MKRIPKAVFFIVAILILCFSFTSVFGVSYFVGDNRETVLKGIGDIRWGTDIRGGVEATFRPVEEAGGKKTAEDSEDVKETEDASNAEDADAADVAATETVADATEVQKDTEETTETTGSDVKYVKIDASDEDLESARAIIETRMISQGITDYELYADTRNDLIIVRYPWKAEEQDYDVDAALKEISSTAHLTFRAGNSYDTSATTVDANGDPVYKTPTGETEEILMDGNETVKDAQAGLNDKGQNIVVLTLNDKGKEQFAKITKEHLGKVVSIWMDDVMISAPEIQDEITGGEATISGNFDAQSAEALARKIKAGALPFKLETVSSGSISASLGENSLVAMGYAGVIAFILIAIFMIIMYRLPGVIAVVALTGQMGITIAAISGYFPVFNSFTMTLPGIAGLILSIGMGVDANVITAERIMEEMRSGRTLDGALDRGSKSSLSAIVDGNMTIVIVSIILLLVFGPTNILSWIFGQSTTGAIYSFGYTLLVGVIANFIMGIGLSRLMLRSVAGFKWARHKWLYGGAKDGK